MIIQQVLHGYREGHTELARSAALTSEEQYLLSRLSDLSGYADHQDPEPYLTGYPCGRFFVVARTWIDPHAERRGTVLTHSLLVDLRELADLHDLRALTPLLRQPAGPADTAPYAVPLRALTDPEDSGALRQQHASLVGAWLEREGPLVWVDSPREGGVLAWWTTLPEEARARATFCTHALLPRYLDRQIFDVMITGPETLRHFVSLSDRLRIVRATESPASPPWLGPLLEDGWRVWEEARALGLPLERPRLVLRYLSLRARRDHASIIGSLDVLGLLGWSVHAAELQARADTWVEVVGGGLAGLPPILDVVARDISPRLTDPRAFEEVILRGVRRLVPGSPPKQIERLWRTETSLQPRLREAILDAVPAMEPLELHEWLSLDDALVRAMVPRLGVRQQAALLQQAQERELVLQVTDPHALCFVRPVAGWVLDRAALSPESFVWLEVLRHADEEVVMAWLEAEPERIDLPGLRSWILQSRVMVTWLASPPPGAVLARLLTTLDPQMIRERLPQEAAARAAWWAWALEYADGEVSESIARACLALLSDDELLGPLADEVLERLTRSRWQGRFVRRVATTLVQRAFFEPSPGAWRMLSHPALRDAARHLDDHTWGRLAAEAPIPPVVRWLVDTSILGAAFVPLGSFFNAWLHRGWSETEAQALAELLRHRSFPEEPAIVAAICWRCVERRCSEDEALLVCAFARTHDAMYEERDRNLIVRLLRSLSAEGWDKAKHLRWALWRGWSAGAWSDHLPLQIAKQSTDFRRHLDDLDEEPASFRASALVRWAAAHDPEMLAFLPPRLRRLRPA